MSTSHLSATYSQSLFTPTDTSALLDAATLRKLSASSSLQFAMGQPRGFMAEDDAKHVLSNNMDTDGSAIVYSSDTASRASTGSPTHSVRHQTLSSEYRATTYSPLFSEPHFDNYVKTSPNRFAINGQVGSPSDTPSRMTSPAQSTSPYSTTTQPAIGNINNKRPTPYKQTTPASRALFEPHTRVSTNNDKSGAPFTAIGSHLGVSSHFAPLSLFDSTPSIVQAKPKQLSSAFATSPRLSRVDPFVGSMGQQYTMDVSQPSNDIWHQRDSDDGRLSTTSSSSLSAHLSVSVSRRASVGDIVGVERAPQVINTTFQHQPDTVMEENNRKRLVSFDSAVELQDTTPFTAHGDEQDLMLLDYSDQTEDKQVESFIGYMLQHGSVEVGSPTARALVDETDNSNTMSSPPRSSASPEITVKSERRSRRHRPITRRSRRRRRASSDDEPADASADGSYDEDGGLHGGSSSDATPRHQSLRFDGDLYTPRLVRYSGTQKQGFCEQCPEPGKWLQLKTSAFWYHKQFFHGISSITGQYFTTPASLRLVYQQTGQADFTERKQSNSKDGAAPTATFMVEALCKECDSWISVMNPKRRGSVPSGIPSELAAAHQTHQHRRDSSKEAEQPWYTTLPVGTNINDSNWTALEGEPENRYEVRTNSRGQYVFPTGVIDTVLNYTVQEAGHVLKADGMTVLWFRHAYRCTDQQSSNSQDRAKRSGSGSKNDE
ncbi:hypothetical protein SmJEL517_g05347 [Synchytrium microbalum]|uniref:Transcription regulator Rua1 C-terminal domain-containing protein n=1 Tax=Synchytrium microbalum TaxID=1806994 RepID=A0A507BVT6_9FUNG|nr:uncharacterized protein SmJEL517_g05347 [Synchytrium microbalum]TPX31318.1 hypothetical protein SmJEL517_g05347 [Synchytrium microbalum]